MMKQADAPALEAEALTLEALRAKLAGFAAERAWEQLHTPRNLLLALVLPHWHSRLLRASQLTLRTHADRGGG